MAFPTLFHLSLNLAIRSLWSKPQSTPILVLALLYIASPYLAAKNIINLTSVLTIWWCACIESSLGRGCLLWPVRSLDKTLLAFAWSSSCIVLEQLWGDTLYPRAKEKPQQDSWRGEFTFTIKPHSYQRCSEGSNKTCVHQDPETPQRLRQNCFWASPVEVWVGSGLPQGQGLWVQQAWVWHKPRRSPWTPP